MEINLLIILKWLFSGATLLCLGWLSEERRSLKTRVDILEGKISLLAEDLDNVKDKIDVKVAFQYTDTYSDNIISFVNNVKTSDGGTHEVGFKTAIIENPFYAVMNAPNSTMKCLSRKLNILDAIDSQSGSGKLDIIIQTRLYLVGKNMNNTIWKDVIGYEELFQISSDRTIIF